MPWNRIDFQRQRRRTSSSEPNRRYSSDVSATRVKRLLARKLGLIATTTDRSKENNSPPPTLCAPKQRCTEHCNPKYHGTVTRLTNKRVYYTWLYYKNKLDTVG